MAPWWKRAVIYQIYPRSFYDSNNDGIGDIKGIIQKLDYLEFLGVDAVWLSPINRSPMDDFGYDIKDYRRIEPIFGTEADFDELISAMHGRGIRLILDLVMNHTSDKHLWFIESRSSRTSPKRDWYIWHPGKSGRRYPNNWRAAFGGRAWEYDSLTGEYYLHSFLKQQPDINWRNPELKNAIFNDVRFWLDRGVDGFRLDVVNWFIKDERFRSNPYQIGYSPRLYDMQKHIYDRNRPETHDVIREFRRLLDEYPERMSVGEVFSPPPGDQKLSSSYLGNGDDELHMAFDFSFMYIPWDARVFTTRLKKGLSLIPKNGWPCHVFSNHDQPRSYRRFRRRNESRERARIIATLLFTLPGTPFVYYGEEIGMDDGTIRRSELQDPLGKKYWPFFKGRDGARTPMQWSNARNAGFSPHTPWLPVNPDYRDVNVDRQRHDPASLLSYYRQMIRLRRDEDILWDGKTEFLTDGWFQVLCFRRFSADIRITILLNFKGGQNTFTVPDFGSPAVLFSSIGRKECTRKVTLQSYEILILKESRR